MPENRDFSILAIFYQKQSNFSRFNIIWVMGIYNFENLGRFRWKNRQNWKIANFWYFTKIDVTQVQNDKESWNLANLCTIILSDEWAKDFWHFIYFLKVWQVCQKFDNFFKILTKFFTNLAKFQKNPKITKNAVITFLNKIIVYNLAKF